MVVFTSKCINTAALSPLQLPIEPKHIAAVYSTPTVHMPLRFFVLSRFYHHLLMNSLDVLTNIIKA